MYVEYKQDLAPNLGGHRRDVFDSGEVHICHFDKLGALCQVRL